MRRVKLLTGRVLSDGTRQKRFSEIDVPDDEAARLIATKQAWAVEPKPMPPSGAKTRR